MFLFTGPTPKLLNSCGANVVDLMACGHLTHKHTLSVCGLTCYFLRNELISWIGLLRPLIWIQNIVSPYIRMPAPSRSATSLTRSVFGADSQSAIFGLSALDLFFLSHIHKISRLTNSQKRHLCFEKTVRNKLLWFTTLNWGAWTQTCSIGQLSKLNFHA